LLKNVEDDKQLLIQKQIEDDLATHDFSPTRKLLTLSASQVCV
jgi:hypothetical protein